MDIPGTEGDDQLAGTKDPDTLDGRGGNDTLIGLGGDDVLIGGTANDTFHVEDTGDQVVEAVGEGADRVAAYVTYLLAEGVEVEVLEAITLTDTGPIGLTGNEFANIVIGNDGNNVLAGAGGGDRLLGLAGNDTLIGGSGADWMAGHEGDDVYYVDSGHDQVFEGAGDGWDRVRVAGSYSLSIEADVEVLEAIDLNSTDFIRLLGSSTDNWIYGNAGPNELDGVAGDDWLYGLEGDDLLIGRAGDDVLVGGPGADEMRGGPGNDTYYVDNPDDRIQDSGSTGDRVAASVSYLLPVGASVRFLEAITPSATNALDLTGDDTFQHIQGNDGANVLNGRGGTDRLYGLAGDDTLIGGDGDDVLIGGSGNDQMIGGAGADGYYVEDTGDIVSEAPGSTGDRVATTVSYTLAAESEIEIFAVANEFETAAIDLIGNEFANRIFGSDGVNVLSGGRGNDYLLARGGDDVMIGGGGNDTFAFASTLGPENIDLVQDFVSGADMIELSSYFFKGLTRGALPGAAFATGTQAQDSDDRIIYDPASGNLFFDPDGHGDAGPLQFATLAGAPLLAAGDFLVI